MDLAELSRLRPLVLVIGSAEIGGAEKQLVRLARELTFHGVRVEVVFTGAGGPLTRELDEFSIHWKVFSVRLRHNPLQSLVESARLAYYFLKTKPLVVNAWLPESIVIGLLLVRIFSPTSFRVASIRGNSSRKGWLFHLFLGKIYGSAHKVFVNGRHLAQLVVVKYGINPNRVEIIYNGVEISDSIANVAVQPPVAVVVANFWNYKGHALLLDALVKVKSPLKVRLCGSGFMRDAIAGEIVEKNLGSIVAIVDEPVDVAGELQGAQFAVHPSLTEGLSNAILEELASGLPVIAFDIEGNTQVITNGENGLLVKAGDIEALAAAIDLIASDAKRRSELSSNARKRALDFSWESNIQRYENSILSLMSASDGSSHGS